MLYACCAKRGLAASPKAGAFKPSLVAALTDTRELGSAGGQVKIVMSKKQSVKSNRVCFTVNNYSEEESTALQQWLTSVGDQLKYCIVGKEKGEKGTPHLQGFIHFLPTFLKAKEGTVSKWKSFPGMSRCHLENARGTDLQSRDYCSKDGQLLIELGNPEPSADQWTQLARAKSLEECIKIDAEAFVKHHFQLVAIVDRNNVRHAKDVIEPLTELREWQVECIEKLMNQNDRCILFVIDEEGSKGKSVLANHLVVKHNAFLCIGGKIADLSYAFMKHMDANPESNIAIIDMARCNSMEFMPWNFMEQLKNRRMTSSKYKSRTFFFDMQRVVVFLNHDPDRGKLSSDRWNDVMYI